MAHFPMFVDLEGKTVLMVGTGHHVEEKTAKLASFGCALVHTATEDFTEELLEPAPAFVVLCDRHHPRNVPISQGCREKHIPVNAVDDPPLCDFQFPALIRRGPMTVAISTDGKVPAAGRLLREEIEARLPDRTEEILEWSAALTRRLREEIPEFHRRSELLNRILRRSFALGRPLTEAELEALGIL